jgi:hypothetical protein
MHARPQPPTQNGNEQDLERQGHKNQDQSLLRDAEL